MNPRTVKATIKVLQAAADNRSWNEQLVEDFILLKRYINKDTTDRRTRRKFALLMEAARNQQ